MNRKCMPCKGRGVINRDGKMTKTGKPYDVVCPSCNGVGHYRDRYADPVISAALSGRPVTLADYLIEAMAA